MKHKFILLILPLLVAPITTRTMWFSNANAATAGVHEIQTISQLQEYTGKGKAVIVKVYTTWCGPCKQLAPVFEKLAQSYDNATFLSHNAESGDGSIKRKYNVRCFPTIIFIDKNGKASVEEGFMGPQELDYYVQAATGKVRITDGPDGMKQVHKIEAESMPVAPKVCAEEPAPAPKVAAAPQPAASAKHSAGSVTIIHSMAELDKHREDHGGVVLLYIGTAWCGPCKKLYPKFEQLATEYKDIRFLKIDGDEPGSSSVKAKYLKFGYPNIVIIDKAGNAKNIIGDVPVEFIKSDIASVKANGASQVEYFESESSKPDEEYRPAGMQQEPMEDMELPAQKMRPAAAKRQPKPSKTRPTRARQNAGKCVSDNRR